MPARRAGEHRSTEEDVGQNRCASVVSRVRIDNRFLTVAAQNLAFGAARVSKRYAGRHARGRNDGQSTQKFHTSVADRANDGDSPQLSRMLQTIVSGLGTVPVVSALT